VHPNAPNKTRAGKEPARESVKSCLAVIVPRWLR
jgi:hypothetical protein